jgi:hypothetical protein
MTQKALALNKKHVGMAASPSGQLLSKRLIWFFQENEGWHGAKPRPMPPLVFLALFQLGAEAAS